jgi:hypothetical protein
MRRLPLLLLPVLAILAGAGFATADDDEPPRPPTGREIVAADPQLRSGAARYAAYVRAELPSLRAAKRARDWDAVVLHAGRIAPAGRDRSGVADTLAAVRRAARLLEADARHAGERSLLGVEARVAGAAVAFDAIRDAVWSTDDGLVGSIDERLREARSQLDRHRRGGGFVGAGSLRARDRRALAEALHEYAWRLALAGQKVAP